VTELIYAQNEERSSTLSGEVLVVLCHLLYVKTLIPKFKLEPVMAGDSLAITLCYKVLDTDCSSDIDCLRGIQQSRSGPASHPDRCARGGTSAIRETMVRRRIYGGSGMGRRSHGDNSAGGIALPANSVWVADSWLAEVFVRWPSQHPPQQPRQGVRTLLFFLGLGANSY
jgi:hypothetical protein